MPRTVRLPLGILAASVLALGCGGEPDAPAGKAPDNGPASLKTALPATQRIALDSLPGVGDPLPVVDDGRIQLRLPKDWSLLPRSKNFLIGGRLRKDAKYPQVLLTAEASTDGPPQITADNVAQFARATRRELEETVGLMENAVPVQIGEFVGVRYAKRGKSGDARLERMFLVTVVGGRKYLVELRALEGTLNGFRQYGETVAGHLNFSPTTDQGSPAP